MTQVAHEAAATAALAPPAARAVAGLDVGALRDAIREE